MRTPTIRRVAKIDSHCHRSINVDLILTYSSNYYKKLHNLYLQFRYKMVKINSTYYHSFWRDLFVKKIVASLLSLSLVLSASVSALAAEPAKSLKAPQKAASANDPYEPNDDPAFAPYINSNTAYTAAINHNRDADFFNFYAKPGNFTLAFSRLSSSKHTFTILVRKQGETKGETIKSEFGIKGNTTLSVNIPEEGNYYIYLFSTDAAFDTTPINPMPYTFKAFFNQ
ncbi:hypothetical protein HP570_28800 [Brevibacillus sp. RS1.1]|nr:hypothetical protein [Brevibacillus sp. RS1.1]